MSLFEYETEYNEIKTSDKTFFNQKMPIFHLFLDENICCGAHWNRLNETVQMSTNNICYSGETRILDIWTHPSSRADDLISLMNN